MIHCDVCGDYYPPEEMWIVGPFPLFTYLDNSLCNNCLDPLLRFLDTERIRIETEEPYESSLWYTNYAEMRDDLCKRASKSEWSDERECPICEGIMGDGWNEKWDCFSFTCLNCGYEVPNDERKMRK